MSEQERELVSMFADDELDGHMQSRLIDRLANDDELRARLAGYRMIGDCLRGESIYFSGTELADRVRAQLAEEPTVLAPSPNPIPRWWQPAIGGALAASVATAALILAPQLLGTNTPPTSLPQFAQTPAADTLPTMVPQLVTEIDETSRWRRLQTRPGDRLSRYLIDHNEFAGRAGLQGPAIHASFVSYDVR